MQNSVLRMPTVDFRLLREVRCLHIEGLLNSHESHTVVVESFFRGLFSQLFSSFIQSSNTDPSKPTRPPPIERISISLSLDEVGTYSFYGMPEYQAMEYLTWCKLPRIIEEALAPFPNKFDHLEVALKLRADMPDSQRDEGDRCVRAGVWKRFSEKGKLHVEINEDDMNERV
jgi:hypothetical protein